MCPIRVAVPWAALTSTFPRPPDLLLFVEMVSFLKDDTVPRTLREYVEHGLPFSGTAQPFYIEREQGEGRTSRGAHWVARLEYLGGQEGVCEVDSLPGWCQACCETE